MKRQAKFDSFYYACIAADLLQTKFKYDMKYDRETDGYIVIWWED